MLNQSLTKLDTRLVKIISKKSQLPPSIELTNFYDSILSLHENIRIHLRHQEWDSKCKTSHNQSQQDENKLTKSIDFALGPTVHNEEEIFCTGFESQQVKSLRENAGSRGDERKRIKLATAMSEDKNFQRMMEKIKVIILYQNKVEKQLALINNHENMTQICLEENSYIAEESRKENKENVPNLLDFDSLKEDIKKVIDGCKNIQEVHDSFQVNQGSHSIQGSKSENQSTDKKSLLTQMLRQSQIIDSEGCPSPSLKKKAKKPISQSNILIGSSKRLQKQLDFQNYKISGMHLRREKKGQLANCGQCSQCAIF